jgi:cytochrome P450
MKETSTLSTWLAIDGQEGPLQSLEQKLAAASLRGTRTQVGAGALTADDISRMPYLQAVVLETLRLRPPAYIVGRCAAQAAELGAFSLRPGEEHSFNMRGVAGL